ncbi:hypothetical protein [Streptomyces sp. NPDC055099]
MPGPFSEVVLFVGAAAPLLEFIAPYGMYKLAKVIVCAFPHGIELGRVVALRLAMDDRADPADHRGAGDEHSTERFRLVGRVSLQEAYEVGPSPVKVGTP